MKIAFLSSEVSPFSKTGGLADVSAALPHTLSRKGCQVKIFTPWYQGATPQEVYAEYGLTSLSDNLDIVFVKNDGYFLRDGLYGAGGRDYPDNLERFSFYCRKSLELLKIMGFSPDIIHANDWQTALVNIYLKIFEKNGIFFKNTRTVLTIHNLAYQGLFEKGQFPRLGINWNYFSLHFLEFYGKINLLKGGIIFSDMVNTVSPTYAQQIRTKEYGCGLDDVLKDKGESVWGILNAVDYTIWDPATDPFIYKKYGIESVPDKMENKVGLQKEMGLIVDPDVFLLGMVARLTDQKGVDLLVKILDTLLEKTQLVVLGTGDTRYHRILEKAAGKHPGRFSLHLAFDETVAHKIYAACDAFLMPSRFEPCGLSQLISYKYLTVPIVHATGGLSDTVKDHCAGGGGFVFDVYRAQSLFEAIERARKLFTHKEDYACLQQKIGAYNFSWDKAAQHYLTMYQRCQSLQ